MIYETIIVICIEFILKYVPQQKIFVLNNENRYITLLEEKFIYFFLIIKHKVKFSSILLSMKRSIIGQFLPNRLDLQSRTLDIPKCQNSEQFFTIGHIKKKKKNNNLTTSLSLDHTISSIVRPFQTCNNFPIPEEKLKFNDALTTVTDSTSNGQKTICFKKTQLRQKLNKGQKLSTQKQRYWSSANKKQRTTTPQKQIRILSKFSTSQLASNKKKWEISDFILLKKIGEGSYSEVFLAIQKETNFVCSIKKIKKQIIKAEKIYDVIIRQLKIHHFIKHPSAVQLYCQFDDKENIYLVCQYCTEGDLHKYIKSKNQQSEQVDLYEVSQIIRQICEAVETMHKNSLMHRDIKPQNVFLTMGNIVKLGDFGWSVYYGDHGLRNTQCGTPLYLAPQLVKQNEYSETVDIWAIGVLAYELLTGQIPFKIRTAQDISKIVTQNIKFEYIQDEMARDFVMRLLQRDVNLRMQIEEVLEHPFLHIQDQ